MSTSANTVLAPDSKPVLVAGALMAFLAVLTGAFGAHGLKGTLSAYEMDVFKTGVHYQMMHALGLLAIGLLMQNRDDVRLRVAARLMFAGMVLFSGSLYILALSGVKWLGMITPVGGVCFLAAWLLLALGILRAG